MTLMLWLSSLALAGPACDKVATAEDLSTASNSAFNAMSAGDPQKSQAMLKSLNRMLTCTDAPVPAAQVAEIHRAHAALAQHAGDRRGAIAAAAAAMAAAPDVILTLPGPEGAMLVTEAQSLALPAGVSFGTPLATSVFVNGLPGAMRPVGQPMIVQAFAPGGAHIGSAWVSASAPLPEWVAFPPVDCDRAVPSQELVAEVWHAEAAYAKLDVQGFEDALYNVAVGIPCTAGTVELSQAAAVHRLEGLRQFTHDNASQAIRSFQSAQMLDPGYTPSEAMFPRGSSLTSLWQRAGSQSAVAWVAVELPPDLTLIVDGIRSRQRPAALPSIVQVTSPSGMVLWSQYVPPGGDLPELSRFLTTSIELEAELTPPALAVYQREGRRRKTRKRRDALWGVGGLLIGASGIAFAANTAAVYDYNQDNWSKARLDDFRRSANISATVSTGLFISGSALLAGGFAVPIE